MTSNKKRPTWRRCLLALALGTGVGLAVGCASDRGVATQDAIDTAIQEAVTPVPQAAQPFAVLPKPVVPGPAEERFDVDVMGADAREFFMGLVAGTSRNLIVHPDVTGTLTLTLKQVTLPEVLETVRDVYGYDYRRTGGLVHRDAGHAAEPRVRDRLLEPDPRRHVAHSRELRSGDADERR